MSTKSHISYNRCCYRGKCKSLIHRLGPRSFYCCCFQPQHLMQITTSEISLLTLAYHLMFDDARYCFEA